MQNAKVCLLSDQEHVCFRTIKVYEIWKRFTSIEKRLFDFPNCWSSQRLGPYSVVPLAKLMYLITHSILSFFFFLFCNKIAQSYWQKTNPPIQSRLMVSLPIVLIVMVVYKVGSPRDLGGRPLGTLYATTRGTITSRCYTCVYLSLPKYDCKNMILYKRISMGWLCPPQARLTMEEVKWSAFPFDGIPIPIDLFPKCHYINILTSILKYVGTTFAL